MDKKRVVVTGMGVTAPNGVGIADFTRSLQQGKSGIRLFPEHADLNFRCQIGGFPEVSSAYMEKLLPTYYSEKLTNKGVINACLAGIEAWKSAGLEIESEERIPRSGIIIGAGALGWDNSTDWIQETIKNGENRKLGTRVIPQNMNSGASSFLNQILGLGGKVSSNSSACITGSEAILHGYQEIISNRADLMVVGSTEGEGKFSWAAFDSMRVLNTDSNHQPQSGSRPMSATSSGFVPSGGAGVLILESYDHAMERGAPILAEILGGAQNCGGMRNGGSMTAPNASAVIECIENAVADAGIASQEIDLISGHLTSTRADPLEIQNWITGLGLKGEEMPYINAPKSMFGHCIAGAGSVESVACIIQIHQGFIHKNINLTSSNIHPQIKEMLPEEKINLETMHQEVNTIIKANFGFGDLNCCLVFRKFVA